MELVCDGSWVTKPRASFMLEKNAQLLVYKWFKSLRFPDGHALNISRLVNTEECKLYVMKSHDCHVFMQTLIPLAFRDLLPKGIWDALTEISHFFRDICSSKLNVNHIEMLETNIIEPNMQTWDDIPPIIFWLNGASTRTFTIWGKSWRTSPVYMDVFIREVRYYSCNEIHN